MRLHFLAAEVPLTKTFALLPNGTIDKSAYPHVRNFTSIEMEVNNPDEFHAAITANAQHGHCLLKGQLLRPLQNESRAGSTNSITETQWSCFDIDGLPDVASPEDFVHNILPPEFHDVDYILQWSASSGIASTHLRCHLFFMHSVEFSPEQAKLWLTDLNLSSELLSNHLSLTASAMALKFPLDRTVMQNDKLIYIAPPILNGDIEDPIPQRIQLIRKAKRLCDHDFSLTRNASAIDAAMHDRIDDLRRENGLRRKRPRYRILETGERLLLNPEIATVTGERRDRDYMRLNLNGGDSWAYYYQISNPKFLYNFKGEPIVVLADFLPQYWQDIQPRLQEERQGIRPFAFRQMSTDTLFNGLYDPVNERIVEIAATSGGRKLNDFFWQFDIEHEANIDWIYEFQPYNTTLIDFDRKFCNKWQRTDYQRLNGTSTRVPPTIDKILQSVLGNDPTCYQHFLNWLAAIWQTRQKLGTAWILHGVQGTGKGVLFHSVLVPLFGERYCVTKQLKDFDDKFNAELETCLLFNIDEVKLSAQTNSSRTLNQLKALITEPVISVRAMRQNATQVKNYTNFILTSNDFDAMAIDEYDRRFNVAPRQEQRIQLTIEDIDAIQNELMEFACFLNGFQVNLTQARTVLDNPAKQQMRINSMDSIEQLAYALHTGNLEFFLQFLESAPSSGFSRDITLPSKYKDFCHRAVNSVGSKMVVTRADCVTLFKYLAGEKKYQGPQIFDRLMSHKRVMVNQLHVVNGERQRGVVVEWLVRPDDLDYWRTLTAPDDIPAGPGVLSLIKTAPKKSA